MTRQSPDDVSNTALYQLITHKVLPALEEIKLHQVKTNGRVNHLEEREDAHTEQLQAGREKRSELDQRLTRVEATSEVHEKYQDRDIGEAKQERKGLRQEVFRIGMEVAKVVGPAGIVALIFKLTE